MITIVLAAVSIRVGVFLKIDTIGGDVSSIVARRAFQAHEHLCQIIRAHRAGSQSLASQRKEVFYVTFPSHQRGGVDEFVAVWLVLKITVRREVINDLTRARL